MDFSTLNIIAISDKFFKKYTNIDEIKSMFFNLINEDYPVIIRENFDSAISNLLEGDSDNGFFVLAGEFKLFDSTESNIFAREISKLLKTEVYLISKYDSENSSYSPLHDFEFICYDNGEIIYSVENAKKIKIDYDEIKQSFDNLKVRFDFLNNQHNIDNMIKNGEILSNLDTYFLPLIKNNPDLLNEYNKCYGKS